MKNSSVHASLVSGAIGVLVGAVTVMVVQTSLLQAMLHSAAYSRPTTRMIEAEGYTNFEDRSNERPDVMRGAGF